MTDEPKRRVLPDQPALLAVNKCAKVLEGLSDMQIEWVLMTLKALYVGELKDSAAKG